MSATAEPKAKKKKKNATSPEADLSPSTEKKKKKKSRGGADELNLDELEGPSDLDQPPGSPLSFEPGVLRQSSSTILSRGESPVLPAQEPSAAPTVKIKKKKKKKGEEPQDALENEDSTEKLKGRTASTSNIKELEDVPEDGEEKGNEDKLGGDKSGRKKSKKSIAKGKEPEEAAEVTEDKSGDEKSGRKSKKSIAKGKETEAPTEDGEDKSARKKSKKSISKGKEPEEVPEDADSVTSYKKSKKKKNKGEADSPEAENVQVEEKTEVSPSTSKKEIDSEATPLGRSRKSNTDNLRCPEREPETECCRKARENEERRRREKERQPNYGFEQRRYDSPVCSGYKERSSARASYGTSLPQSQRRTDPAAYSTTTRTPAVSDRREFWRGNPSCTEKPEDDFMRRFCTSTCSQDRARAPLYRPEDTYRRSACLNQREYGTEVAGRSTLRPNPRTQLVQRWGNDEPGWNQQNMYRSPEQSARGQTTSYRTPELHSRKQQVTYRAPVEQVYRQPQRPDAYQRFGPSTAEAHAYRPIPSSGITPFNTDSGVGITSVHSCPGQRAGKCDDVYRNALPARILVNIARGNDYRDPHNFYNWKTQSPATSLNAERAFNWNPQAEGPRRQTRGQLSKSFCSNRPRAFANNSACPASPTMSPLSSEAERSHLLRSLTQLTLSDTGELDPSSYSFLRAPERTINTGLFASESESCVLTKLKKPDFKPSDIRRDRPLLHTFSQISPPFPKVGWYSLTRSEPSSRTSEMFSPMYSETELLPSSLTQSCSRDLNISLPHSR